MSEMDEYISVMNSTHSLAYYWSAYNIIQIVVLIMLVFRC